MEKIKGIAYMINIRFQLAINCVLLLGCYKKETIGRPLAESSISLQLHCSAYIC